MRLVRSHGLLCAFEHWVCACGHQPFWSRRECFESCSGVDMTLETSCCCLNVEVSLIQASGQFPRLFECFCADSEFCGARVAEGGHLDSFKLRTWPLACFPFLTFGRLFWCLLPSLPPFLTRRRRRANWKPCNQTNMFCHNANASFNRAENKPSPR